MSRHQSAVDLNEPLVEPTRRQFVAGLSTAMLATAAGCASASSMRARAGAPTDAEATTGPGKGQRKAATDIVVLGNTGIRTSRLAMGSGSHGSGGSSDQTRLGLSPFASLLVRGFDRGLTFFETADSYGAHPHVAEAIKQVGRKNVTILTKTQSETAAGVEADLARFRRELGVDTLDVVLLHCKTSSRWTAECEGAMEALARAKQKGAIRAHGVSCHSLSALRLAAATPWVDVDLARINPAGVAMDSDPATVIAVLRQMKAAGKGVIGMKILGEGALAGKLDMAIAHAARLDVLDAFTIGFTTAAQMDQVVQRIAASGTA